MGNVGRTYAIRVPRAVGAALLAALLLAFAVSVPCSAAETEELKPITLDDIEEIEITALEAEYNDATARVAKAGEIVAENQAKIEEIQRELPDQRKRADAAATQLYEMHSNRLYYVDFILNAQSFGDFLKQLEYFERVTKANLQELDRLDGMLAALEIAGKALSNAQAEADEQVARASEAFAAMQEKRVARQERGQTESLEQDDKPEILDGADWHMTEGQFVAEWAPRIDAYLEYTPMEGLGKTFAQMAYRYCVDPRWSPAISFTESGNGQVCIRPYNAWGWGAVDSDPYNSAAEWESWDEAIEAHVKGLASDYGYTISKYAAEKYCSTPDSWYEKTLEQMARI